VSWLAERVGQYRAGRSARWIKVKNPKSPAMVRVKDGTWWRRLNEEKWEAGVDFPRIEWWPYGEENHRVVL
jgi:hypothetical protein